MNPSTLTTVICAIYKKDRNRYDLLKGHMKNLDSQTVAAARVYVFEDNDQPPEWLVGEHIVLSRCCTIYEAWNLALSMVRTPYIMNLNLDDRLNTDAIEKLQQALDRDPKIKIACGEWLVTFNQHDTDQVVTCFEGSQIQEAESWPPVSDSIKVKLWYPKDRIGSLGPATMWRAESLIDFPRYPYRTTTGSLLEVDGDRALWLAMNTSYGKDAIRRLPLIIGNYHSHPGEQAEFRGKTDPAELRLEFATLDEIAIY